MHNKKKIFRYSAGFTLTYNQIKMLLTYDAMQNKINTMQAMTRKGRYDAMQK